MITRLLKNYKKDTILYILISFLIIITTTLFVSLHTTSYSLQENYREFSEKHNKNDFIIVPDNFHLDEIINQLTPYEFDVYQAQYKDTAYRLNYQHIQNIENNQYLSQEEIDFIEKHINSDFIERMMASTKPSLVIYHEIRPIIYTQLDESLNNYYRNKIADTQATYYTKLLLLLSLNVDNYLKFIEYTLDNRLLATDENNKYLKNTIAYQYDLTIEKKIVYQISNQLNQKDVRYYVTTKQKVLNQPYILKSLYSTKQLDLNRNEIAIYQEFAVENNLQLGDYLNINEQAYQIVAFIYTPDSIYPLLSINQFHYKPSRDTIIMMNEEDFNAIYHGKYSSIFYTASFNHENRRDEGINTLKKVFSNNQIFLNPKLGLSDNILRHNIQNLNLLSYVLSFSILIITILFMAVQLIRLINSEQKEIGLLKALGYYEREIMYTYLKNYLILILFSSFIGFITGLIGSRILFNYLLTLFRLPVYQLKISYITLLGIMISIILMICFNMVILKIKLKKKSVLLLNQTNMIYQKEEKYPLQLKLKISIIIGILLTYIVSYLIIKNHKIIYLMGIFIIIYFVYQKITSKQTFYDKIALKMSNRNIKKIVSFNITFLFATLLILFIFYAKTVYDDYYNTVKIHNSYVFYNRYPNFLNLTVDDLLECSDDTCNGMATYKFDIYKINGELINSSSTFEGFKKNSKPLINYVDTSLLEGNNIIISKPIAEKFKLKVNDTITVLTNEIDENSKIKCSTNPLEYCKIEKAKIVNISENLTNRTIYVSLDTINQWYYGDTLHPTHINTVFSTSHFASHPILSKNILYSFNIQDLLGQLYSLFYTVILITNFSFILISIISIIMIFMIMELTIKENENQIALLKSMGYKSKEIKKMLLSYYHPYFLMIFFLTIPISYFASTILFKYIGLTMHISIPVQIHLINLFLAFLIVWSVYLTTSYLARLRIKFISLANWLK